MKEGYNNFIFFRNVGGIAFIKNRQEIRKLTTCMHADSTVVFSQTWCNSVSVISKCSGHYDVKSWLNFFKGYQNITQFSMILNSCIVAYDSISNLIYFLAVFSIPKVDPL